MMRRVWIIPVGLLASACASQELVHFGGTLNPVERPSQTVECRLALPRLDAIERRRPDFPSDLDDPYHEPASEWHRRSVRRRARRFGLAARLNPAQLAAHVHLRALRARGDARADERLRRAFVRRGSLAPAPSDAAPSPASALSAAPSLASSDLAPPPRPAAMRAAPPRAPAVPRGPCAAWRSAPALVRAAGATRY